MAVITSVQSGVWSDTATWGGAVPAQSDDVTINAGHVVTLDVATTNDKSITNNGTLTLAADLQLGSGTYVTYKYCAFTIGPASIVNGAGTIRPRAGKVRSTSTSDTWAHMGGTAAWGYTAAPTSDSRVDWEIQYVSFANGVDHGFATAGATLLTAEVPYSRLVFRNCVFANLVGARFGTTSSTRGGVDLVIENCDFRNVKAISIRINNEVATGIRSIKGCTFLYDQDSTLPTFIPGESGPRFYEDNVFLNYQANGAYARDGDTHIGGFYSRDNKTTPNLLDGPLQGNAARDSYFYLPDIAPVNSNPHPIVISRIFDSVMEQYGSEPNAIIGSTAATDLAAVGNLVLGKGDLVTTLSTGARDYLVKNNTVCTYFTGDNAQVVVVETNAFVPLSTGMTVRNNLQVCLASSVGQSYLLGGYLANGLVADSDYNAQWNMKDWARAGVATNSNLGLNNINADPQFVDPTRTFMSWITHVTGTATPDYKGGWAYMAAKNGYDAESKTQKAVNIQPYGTADLKEWVRAGYAPQNLALATAGEGGTYVGAVALAAVTPDPEDPPDSEETVYTLELTASALKVAPGGSSILTASLKLNGTPAEGKAVAWSLTGSGGSGSGGSGSLSVASADTNASGQASVTFTAAANSAQGSVLVMATHADTTTGLTLTVKNPAPAAEGNSIAYRFFGLNWS